MTTLRGATRRILLLALALVVLPVPANAGTSAVSGWLEQPPIASKPLGETRHYRIWLPPAYNENPKARFPVLYILDAQGNQQHVLSTVQFLASVEQIPELIVVAVDSGNRLRDFTPTDTENWVGDGGAANFLAFLRDELIPAAEKDLRTSDLRIIWGHSASALLALHTLYAEPALFDAYLVIDGDLGWDNKLLERELKSFFTKAKQTQKFLYFNSSYQLDENPESNVFVSLANMLKNHAPESLRWVYEPMPEETHVSIPLKGSIHALRALFDGYQVPEPVMFQGLDAVEAHYTRIHDQLGAPRQTPEAVLNEIGYLMIWRNIDEALRAFELAVERYPESANAWDSLSDGYLEAGRLQEALHATEKSIRLAKEQTSENLVSLLKKREDIQAKMQ